MENFLKAVCCILICSVVCVVLNKQGKDFSVVLILLVCCLVVCGAVRYLRPVVELMDRLAELGQVNTQLLSVLLKAVGIALLSEITCLVCKDAGSAALGKGLQILSVSVILWLCIPLFNELIDLLDLILDNV